MLVVHVPLPNVLLDVNPGGTPAVLGNTQGGRHTGVMSVRHACCCCYVAYTDTGYSKIPGLVQHVLHPTVSAQNN